MRIGTIAFLLGCLALQHCAELPSPACALLLVPLVYLARYRAWLRVPVWAVAGFVWALLRATIDLAQPFDTRFEGVDLTVEGYIAGIPETQERGVRVFFDVTRLSVEDRALDWTGRVRLGWYQKAPDLQVGERWRLHVSLKQAHGFSNPGGFDYEGWLYQQGIRATGSVRADADNRRLAYPDWHYALGRARQHIGTSLARAAPDSPYLGILTALVIGAQDGISAAQWRVFTRTGTSHLVAVSGLNITLVAGLVAFLAWRIWACMPPATLYLAAPKAAVIAALFAATGYALLAGFSIPTQRALLMLVVALGARLWDRPIDPGRALALALLAVLFMHPAAPLAAGFWLSFGAVGVLLYGMCGRLGPGVWWRKWGRVQWLVALGLLPMTLILFQRASLIAPLANLVAEPGISLLVTPLALLAALALPVSDALGSLLLRAAAAVLDGIWRVLAMGAELPGAAWSWSIADAWIAVLAVIGVLLLLAPRGLPARWLGVVLLVPMVLVRPPLPPPGAVWFTLLDVGQGLAAVVRTRHHTLVFDAGPRFSDSFDTGSAVVLPYLRAQGIDVVDKLLISHGDNDHIGGAAAILDGIPVAELISSELQRFARPVSRCRAGQSWRWDGVEFRIMHPDTSRDWQDNNSSCVLRVTAPGGRLLLTGDIEAGAERHLLHEDDLRADILVAPHHGSRTSSTRDFIAAVAPEYVLFPVGYRNRYGFPRPDVAARYAEAGAQRLDSAVEGAIEFRIDPVTGMSAPASWRRAARRYWNWQPPP